MLSKASFIKFVTKIWGNQTFLILLIINILSNLIAVVEYNDAWSVVLILCISALSATIESCFCHLFRNTKVRNTLMWILVAFHVAFAIVDAFLAVNFRQIFTIDSVGIIAETTPEEINSFFSSYLSAWNVLLIIVGTVFIIWSVIKLSRKLIGNKVIALTAMLLSLMGVFLYGQMFYNHATKGEGGASLSQLHSFTRVGYSLMGFRSSIEYIKSMRAVNSRVTATLRQDSVPSVIVIIGESFTLYHSSLYGYSKQTNPLLSQRVNEGSMIVYDDVVSPSDRTGVVLTSVFTVSGSDEPMSNEVFFPTFFRKAGYKTVFVSNQYFAGQGVTWITDPKLSRIMYDYRNARNVGMDENLLNEIPDYSDPQLILIHLFGQHFTYSKRYPPGFKHFAESDYSDNLSQDEREVAAHYDNATLYNDYVVDKVIRKYENKNCIVVYFSDHGEEIYEVDDFMGHGNANTRPTIKYQIRVPLMIWTSNEFQKRYPDIVTKLKEAKHTPITTEYMSHFLLDLAGVETKYCCPDRSFINDQYQEPKSRYVLGGTVDYDTIKEDTAFKPRYR